MECIMKNLTEGKPIKLIILFAIPLFIGQLFQLMYSLADTRIVGETLGETALAAVGATTSLSDLLTNLVNGINSGFGIIIATYFGASNRQYMKKSIAGTFILSVGITVIISAAGLLFLKQILELLNISKDLLEQSMTYIRIIFAGLMASTLYNMCAAVLRAIGDSFTPLIFLIVSTVLNVALDYGFILGLNLGVAGAAYATVISQGISALFCFIYMYRRYPELRLSKKDFSLEKGVLKKLLSNGMSMGFMISFVHIGTVALQTAINTLGTDIIVAHTAARKATSVFMLPFSVFGTTLATYCGQNLGAGKTDRIKKGIKDTVAVTFVWCLIVILAAYTVSPAIITLITATDTPAVIDTAALYLRVNTSLYFVPAVICLFRNSMQGFGDTKTPVFSSSLELIGKILISAFLVPAIGYWGVIVAEPIVWVIMVIPLILRMRRL